MKTWVPSLGGEDPVQNYLWQIHFDIWQNKYNIVKLNKIKLKKILKKKKKELLFRDKKKVNLFSLSLPRKNVFVLGATPADLTI